MCQFVEMLQHVLMFERKIKVTGWDQNRVVLRVATTYAKMKEEVKNYIVRPLSLNVFKV